MFKPFSGWFGYAAVVLVAAALHAVCAGADPVALRAESYTVPPSTQPLVFVTVKNLQDAPYRGTVAMKVPDGWRIAPTEREISLSPGETRRVPFTVERGKNVESNSYSIEVSAAGSGATVVRKQNVVVASAPYFKPTIDGRTDDWKDAIPVTFVTGGKKTVISTFWNRRQFSILVEVEKDKLIRAPGAEKPGTIDAVQIAISPQGAKTGTSADDEATRYEFLLVATGEGNEGECFQLAEPGMKLAEAAKCRELAPLKYENAQVAVRRSGGVTCFECSLPFGPMRKTIRPAEGREFYLSVLVHDPDGTGIRDWGEAAGLWPSQRNRLAWSRWQGAQWGEQPPMDNKVEWGFCTSKY